MSRHVTIEEREVIAQRKAQKVSQANIARELKRSPSTISREVRRNRSRTGYYPARAQAKAAQRRRQRPLTRKMERPEVSRLVRESLRKRHPPDSIAGRSKQLHKDRKHQISHQTI